MLKDLLRENNFMSKVDLKDAYFCVLLHRNHQKFLQFQLKRDFYKIIKDSHCSFEADSNQNNHFSGRHVADESDYKRSRNSQGYIDSSIAESRLCNNFAEICTGALAKDRVSRSRNRLGENDINTTTEKSIKIETEMSKAYFKPQNSHPMLVTA